MIIDSEEKANYSRDVQNEVPILPFFRCRSYCCEHEFQVAESSRPAAQRH
jgi:hypothetical protein